MIRGCCSGWVGWVLVVVSTFHFFLMLKIRLQTSTGTLSADLIACTGGMRPARKEFQSPGLSMLSGSRTLPCLLRGCSLPEEWWGYHVGEFLRGGRIWGKLLVKRVRTVGQSQHMVSPQLRNHPARAKETNGGSTFPRHPSKLAQRLIHTS